MMDDAIEVGTKVKAHNMGDLVGEVYAITEGMATHRRLYSVKFERPGKNRSHGFYYDGEVEVVRE